MINIQSINNAYMYVFGSWTSQSLLNSTAGFPIGTTSEWGYLIWDESNVGVGYTGQVRIDIIDATTSTVLLGDIIKNSDGSPTDISSVGTADIKIVVKLYGLDYPTPRVSNIRIKYKNWNQEQIITNAAKNALLNRALDSTTTTEVYDVRIGNGQSTPLTESSTDITNAVSSAYPINGDVTISSTTTHTETEDLIEIEFSINNSDVIIANGTTMNSIGFRNNDGSKIFIGGTRTSDIVKDADYIYNYKIAFRVHKLDNDLYMLTKKGRNILLDRMFFNSPTYTGIKYGSAGYETSLSDNDTDLTTTNFGPTTFQYTLLDTTKYRLTTSLLMGSASGNGLTYNSIANLNDDLTKQAIFIALLDEDIQKTSTYIYQLNTNHNILTPVSSLL